MDINDKEPHCPICKALCIKRMIGKSIVYDCLGCGDQIAYEAIKFWSVK